MITIIAIRFLLFFKFCHSPPSLVNSAALYGLVRC